MPYTQKNRLIALETPLGEDVLLLQSFTGREAVSRLFNFHLELASEKPPVDFQRIVGQQVTISVTQYDDTERYFNGLVSHFAITGKDESFTHYEMQIVPWIWVLTRYADCRIFHNMTVKEILEKVFENRGFSDFRFNLSETYSKLEYCVQYRETDFNFISRLMEHFGIFYYFEHSKDSHVMVLGDSKSVHQPCPGHEEVGYDLAAGGIDDADVVHHFSLEQEWKSGAFTLTDYNFKTPSTSLVTTESTLFKTGGNDGFEVFDFPGDFMTRSDGNTAAKLRMEEEEANFQIAHGTSNCRAFATGYKFMLTDYPNPKLNQSYVLTEVEHVASTSGTYGGPAGNAGGFSYSNHFTCIPETLQFRPARLTPKPFVQGPQTAIVVGKSDDSDSADDDDTGGDGEEIWVDKYGRVMVRFPWDRKGACSCWVRVSQDWAGQGWGMINIPRVGQEVIVSFLEGDPDRPIITGRVYNAEQSVPYKLPDNGTRTTFKTRSTTGGSDDNYNELRFEDKTGGEQIFVRGEKDYDTRIKNDSREWIGNNQSIIIKNNRLEQVEGDESVQVTGKRTVKVEGDDNLNVTGNVNAKVGQNISIQAGQNLYEKSGQNFAHEAGMEIHLKAGMTMVLEAGTQLSLKVGGSFVDIGPQGVSISGPMVMINSGGSAASGSGSSPTDPAAPDNPDEADDGSKGTKM